MQRYQVVDVSLHTPEPPGLENGVDMYMAAEVESDIARLKQDRADSERFLRAEVLRQSASIGRRHVEIARLKAENKRLLNLAESQDQANEALLNANVRLRTDNDVLKAALRWLAAHGKDEGCYATRDGNGALTFSIPPKRFAPLIAEATKP